MKGNDGTGNIEERDDWQTPQWLFDKLNEQYDFNFDCCAEEDNTKCRYYHSDFENVDVLIKDAWMNPPFTKAYNMFQNFFRVVSKGVAIFRCDNMETKIWQEVILKHATWIFIPKGRISYEGKIGKGSRFPSALIGFNIEPPVELEGYSLFVQEKKDED